MSELIEVISVNVAMELSERNATKNPVIKEIVEEINNRIEKSCDHGLFSFSDVFPTSGSLSDDVIFTVIRIFEMNGYTIDCSFDRYRETVIVHVEW